MDNDKRRNEVEKIYTEYIKKMQSIEQKILRVKGADERLEYIERQVNGGIEAEAKERAAARGSSINPEHAKFLRAFLLKDKEEIKELQKLKPDDFKKEMEDARKQFDKKMEQYKGVKPLITSYDLGMIWNIAQKPLNSLEKKLQKSSDQQPKNPA